MTEARAPEKPQSIETVETLYYYDGPCIVLANLDGQLHYGHAIDRTEEHDVFVYVPITPETAEAIKTDEIDLRNVLAGAETAVVVTFVLDGSWTTQDTTGKEMPDNWLPDPMMRLTVEGSIRAGWNPHGGSAA